MALGLYMDQHVERAITNGLRSRGVDVLTAYEDGGDRLPDPDLLDRATMLNRVLFTRDEDLLAEADHRQQHGITFAGVVYAHKQRVTIGTCVGHLELVVKASALEDMRNKVEYLPL